MLVDQISLVTFDRGVADDAEFLRPDRYRLAENSDGTGSKIARGGGYSYAAASFGAGSLVVDMTRFDRVLRFDPALRLIEASTNQPTSQPSSASSSLGRGLSIYV